MLFTSDFSHKGGETNRRRRFVLLIKTVCGKLDHKKTMFEAYMQEALHHLFLFLLAFCTALCQLDDHTHVT